MTCPCCDGKTKKLHTDGWRCKSCRFTFGLYYAYLWKKYRPIRNMIQSLKRRGESHHEELRRLQIRLNRIYPDLPCIRLPDGFSCKSWQEFKS